MLPRAASSAWEPPVPTGQKPVPLRAKDMDRRVNIPIRVVQPIQYPAVPDADDDRARPIAHLEPDGSPPVTSKAEAEQAHTLGTGQPGPQSAKPVPETSVEVDEWRDLALRLQAEMDNYRKRQRRLAQEQIQAERQRLLGSFLPIVDDLERALAAPDGGDGLRRGVELTHRAAMHLLRKEGVEPIEAENQEFDPNWHEAVATVDANGSDANHRTVVRVIEPGYRLGDRLLRPAKVVVEV